MQEHIKTGGLSLKKTSVIMVIISLVVTALLIITAVMTLRSFQAMNKSTRDYIQMEQAANDLMSASDYLTEEVQCFTVIGDRIHMENYFTEADVTRRREHAIQVMEEAIPDSPALADLKAGMAESLSLMDREYYAMRLSYCFFVSTPSVSEVIPSLPAMVMTSFRMVSARGFSPASCRKTMSIFRTSTGISRSRFRDEYPLPKSSISMQKPAF